MAHPARCTALALLAVLVGTGCVARGVRQDVFKEGSIEVFLRGEKRWTRTLAKNYEHPVTIAPVRLAHILSRIDMRVSAKKEEERVPAIPTEMLFSIAEGISAALAAADENQEVVVMAVRRFKRFNIFERKYLTSFVTYARDDRLYIHMSRSEWEIPPRREDNVPEPRIGAHPMKFRLYSGTAMTLVNPQTVAVEWRDPVFETPTRTKILPSGEVVRKTILLESPQEEWGEEEPAMPALPADLSPEQLRDLADLEEARQQGRITESEYRAARRKILNPG
ncbi:MAG: hypothetical protein OEM49_03380 [Myxococcales bacterium]|nr:hypothetical protein [Myxococcales bacterium]MDH5306970.1 hypothetical protein [Myxococcales bacterium]MDH5565692.1 hypothetical protein [Myxococcales bacterium]